MSISNIIYYICLRRFERKALCSSEATKRGVAPLFAAAQAERRLVSAPCPGWLCGRGETFGRGTPGSGAALQ